MKEVEKWLEPFRQMLENKFSQLDTVLKNQKKKTMSTNKQTTITKDPGNRKLVVVREFDAPLEQVWKAWTEIDLLPIFFLLIMVPMQQVI